MKNSFQRLLVFQDDSPHCAVWTDQAAQLAKEWEATLTGINVEPKVVFHNYVDTSIGDGLGDVQSSVERTRDRKIRETFKTATDRHGITTEWQSMEGDVIVETRRMARYADLTIIGYPKDPAEDLNDVRRVVEHVAIGSGCPTLVLPRAYTQPVTATTVSLCWDGSRESARAMRDAMPLLTAASQVNVLIAHEEDASRPQASAQQIKAHLHAHGVQPAVIEIKPTHWNVGADLLAKASELSSDLIVLGAYGHSRLRELVLGGATRHMLKHAEVPIFLAH